MHEAFELVVGSLGVGPVRFERPAWLLLLIPAWLLVVWIGRKSLGGMGTLGRRVALVIRLVVLALLVGAMAQPQWRRVSRDVAVTVVLDASRSTPQALQARATDFVRRAAESSGEGDRLGLVTAAKDAYVQALPGPAKREIEVQQIGSTDGTNLAEAGRLGMAVVPKDAANRLVFISDGNETDGSLLELAEAARAAKVPIDVLPMEYSYEREVIVERLLAPATGRLGENVTLRVVLSATRAAVGRLTVTLNGEAIDLDPASESLGALVSLKEGQNVHEATVSLVRPGPQKWRAVFEALSDEAGEVGDSIAENNASEAVTFVGSEGRVLVLTSKTGEAEALVAALRAARIAAEVMTPVEGPATLVDLGVYDAVVIVDSPASEFSLQQQEELRAYVHDLGGGLVMTGGPDSYGAGGWIGSPLEDALPVKLDPPQKRQMPRGALVLVMHSCEMPNGNFWGKQTATAAVDALSRQDMAGIVEYAGSANNQWTYPLSILGDKSQVRQAINSMQYGDAPDFVSMLTMSLTALQAANAGQKHVVIISDGDPQPPSAALLQRFVDAKVSISTVAVFPHSWGIGDPSLANMKRIATATGGNYHEITQNNQLKNLPQIFIKEAQTVKRSLIWEGEAFSPAMSGAMSEAMRGLTGPMPGMTGYVVTGEREGMANVVLRGPENDPILAQWQHGLGRVVTFMSDATTRWCPAWVGWEQYRAFWEQHVRWAMRPSGSPNVRVTTVPGDERTMVIVEALDESGERLNFLRWNGRVVGPDLAGQGVELRQVGPGRYEGDFESSLAGTYVVNMRYEGSGDGEGGGGGGAVLPDGRVRRGSVQAAVSRPFSDEYRALRDNRPLLEQVAMLTGGRVLAADPVAAKLWSREGLTMPEALRPIWLAVTCLAIGMFLVDVGVRRVRIDVLAGLRWVRGLFAARNTAAGQSIASLKEAREKARRELAQRAQSRAKPGAEGAEGKRAASAQAKAKFEATAEEMAAGRRAAAQRTDAPAAVEFRKSDAAGEKPAQGGDGMSRLLKAKKRAQDDLDQGKS